MDILQTTYFTVVAPERPHISREDGGHIIIAPKERLKDRTRLDPVAAIELMRLTMIVGEAMQNALNQRGIDVGRINYQENGNWGVFNPEGPHLHIHLYGRAKSSNVQPWGEACHFPKRETGFYDGFIPLNQGDVEAIQVEIHRLFDETKYKDERWHL
jgi:diadenosine tetraphosphate (Ap4A) HIT family hydrolase